MTKEQLVSELSQRLEDRKSQFLSSVQTDVARYIAKQGKGCLALVERIPNGDRQWKPSLHPGYAARLIAFCFEMPYDGHALDSALTEPIAQMVTKAFQNLHEENAQA